MSPNAGGGGSCKVSANEYSCRQKPKKLWRSNSIFNLWLIISDGAGVEGVVPLTGGAAHQAAHRGQGHPRETVHHLVNT
jgi:hypothetical protein